MSKQNAKTEEKKIFVLDTNVLITDPKAFLNMGEHDVVIPLVVITELDKLKNRSTAPLVSMSARQVSANLDKFFGPDLYKDGVSLGEGKGKLFIFILKELNQDVKKIFKEDTPDNRIISVALSVRDNIAREEKKLKAKKKKVNPTTVVLVTNDNNLRFKAGAFNIQVEKYRNKSIRDINSLYSGVTEIKLSSELIAEMCTRGTLSYDKVIKFLGKKAPIPHPNEFFIIDYEEGEANENQKEKILSRFYENDLHMIDNGHKVYGNISVRNYEQRLAMNALLDPKISIVTLSGIAGTGKTLLAIGAALQQSDQYEQILITRAPDAVDGREIGFLPGDATEKIGPYLQGIYDNIKFLKSACTNGAKEKLEKIITDKEKLVVENEGVIRGRSLINTIFIVDETQNLSYLEVLTLVTRIGTNSKIIFIGDLTQIDNKYLDATNSGLALLIDGFKYYEDAAHINLVKGERSKLAEWAATHL
jgi:PhoH-like ATPase